MQPTFCGAKYKLEYSEEAGGKAHLGNYPKLPRLNCVSEYQLLAYLIESSDIHLAG